MCNLRLNLIYLSFSVQYIIQKCIYFDISRSKSNLSGIFRLGADLSIHVSQKKNITRLYRTYLDIHHMIMLKYKIRSKMLLSEVIIAMPTS